MGPWHSQRGPPPFPITLLVGDVWGPSMFVGTLVLIFTGYPVKMRTSVPTNMDGPHTSPTRRVIGKGGGPRCECHGPIS